MFFDGNHLRYGNSAPRNLFLLKYLDNLRYSDGLGRGIPMSGDIQIRLLRVDDNKTVKNPLGSAQPGRRHAGRRVSRCRPIERKGNGIPW